MTVELTSVSKVVGGAYEAERAKDGTWTLKDVPVFAECSRTLKIDGQKVKVEYDKAWLEKAVEAAQASYASNGYMAPTHYRHHSDDDDPELLGFVLPKRVEKVKIQEGGKSVEKWAVIADLPGLKPEAFDAIKSIALPYRSAETTISGDPKISSLALLSSEPSYFPFALTTVGKEVVAAFSRRRSAPALCYSSVDGPRACHFQRFDVPEDKKDEPDENEDVENAGEEEGGDGEKVPKWAQAIIALLQKLVGMEQGQAMPGQPGQETPGVAQMAENTTQTTSTAAAGKADEAATFQAALAKSEGRVAALEAKIESMATEKAKEATIRGALKRLAGFNIPDAEKRVTAKFSEGGEKAVNAFCEGIEEFGTREPGVEWSDGEQTAGARASTEFAEFSDDSDGQRIAAGAAAEYDALHPAFQKSCTRDEHIRFAVHRAGFKPSKNGSK